jgi:hypothetical protein
LVLGETIALYGLALVTFLTCLLFPLISSRFIVPFVVGVYGHGASLGDGNLLIMTIMMGFILLFPLAFLNYGRGVKVVDAYLGGANLQGGLRFTGSANQVQEVALQNYYLHSVLSERWLSRWGVLCCGVLLATMILQACL